MEVSYDYSGTILTVTGQRVRFSQILPNVEPYLVARNDMMNHIEKFIKHKGSKYCFIMEHGVSQMQKNFNKFNRESISALYIKCNQLTVDCSLTRDLWHGINILVTKLNEYPKVIVSSENGESIVWDVSGHDGFELTQKRPNQMDALIDARASLEMKTQIDKYPKLITSPTNGRPIDTMNIGSDSVGGLAGESGGNVRIEASAGENLVLWEIKSNGGNGSSEQNDIRRKYPEFSDIKSWFNAIETKFKDLAAASPILVEEMCEDDKFFKKSFYYDQDIKITLVKGLTTVGVDGIYYEPAYAVLVNVVARVTKGLPGEGGFPGTVIVKNVTAKVRAGEGTPGTTHKTKRHNNLVCLRDFGAVNGTVIRSLGAEGTYLSFYESNSPPDNPHILYKKFDKSLNEFKTVYLYISNEEGNQDRFFTKVEQLQVEGDLHSFGIAKHKSKITSSASEEEERKKQDQEKLKNDFDVSWSTKQVVIGPNSDPSTNNHFNDFQKKLLDASNCVKNDKNFDKTHSTLLQELSQTLILEEERHVYDATFAKTQLEILSENSVRVLAQYKDLKISVDLLRVMGIVFQYSKDAFHELLDKHPEEWIESFAQNILSHSFNAKLDAHFHTFISELKRYNIPEKDHIILALFQKFHDEMSEVSQEDMQLILEQLPRFTKINSNNAWQSHFENKLSEFSLYLKANEFYTGLETGIRESVDQDKLKFLSYNLVQLQKIISASKFTALKNKLTEKINKENAQNMIWKTDEMLNNADKIKEFLDDSSHKDAELPIVSNTKGKQTEDIIRNIIDDELTSELTRKWVKEKTQFYSSVVETLFAAIKEEDCTNFNAAFHKQNGNLLKADTEKQDGKILFYDRRGRVINRKNIITDEFGKQYYKKELKEMLEVILKVCRYINQVKQIKLRRVQLMAILLYFVRDAGKAKILMQIDTGEGKTLILVVIAIVSVILKNENVDVITSTADFAKRDVEANADIYAHFGVKVAFIEDDYSMIHKDYSRHEVIYGDLTSFHKIYLTSLSYNIQLMSGRKTNVILVDEVDSLLLDKRTNILYLAHDIPFLDKFDVLFIEIFQMIQKKINIESIKRCILEQRLNFMSIQRLMDIDPSLINKDIALKIFNKLKKGQIINETGSFAYQDGNMGDPKRYIKVSLTDVDFDSDEKLQEYQKYRVEAAIKFLQREEQQIVPHYLCSFVFEHIDRWINNAKLALELKPNVDYVVDNTAGNSFSSYAKIVLIDRDTGSDLVNAEWEEGLSQFLQLKHHLKMTNITLKSIFVSNAAYFERTLVGEFKTQLMGVTGTLGSMFDQTTLKKVLGVQIVRIPPAERSQMMFYKPIVVNKRKDWLQRIKVDVERHIHEENCRAVLIVCQTIFEAEAIHIYLQYELHMYKENIKLYSRNKHLKDIQDDIQCLKQKTVIVATNLAGRAMDIKLHKDLETKDGLHLILTYMPPNQRIERQALGRVARNGCKGSVRMILLDLKYSGNQSEEDQVNYMIDMKMKRYAKERAHISEVNNFYDQNLKNQELSFMKFITFYRKFVKKFRNKSWKIGNVAQGQSSNWFGTLAETKHTHKVRSACFQMWATHLDRHGDKDIDKFLENLDVLRTDIVNWKAWRGPDIASTILAALETNHRDQFYDDVIQVEPFFCEAAHYYKAKKYFNVSQYDKAIQHLKAAQKLLNMRIEMALYKIVKLISLLGPRKNANDAQILHKPMTQILICNDLCTQIALITGRSIQKHDLDGITSVPDKLIQELQSRRSSEIQATPSCEADEGKKSVISEPLLSGWTILSQISDAKIKFISNMFGVKQDILREIFINQLDSERHTEHYAFLKLIYKKFVGYFYKPNNHFIALPLTRSYLTDQNCISEEVAKTILTNLCEKNIFKQENDNTYVVGSNSNWQEEIDRIDFWNRDQVEQMIRLAWSPRMKIFKEDHIFLAESEIINSKSWQVLEFLWENNIDENIALNIVENLLKSNYLITYGNYYTLGPSKFDDTFFLNSFCTENEKKVIKYMMKRLQKQKELEEIVDDIVNVMVLEELIEAPRPTQDIQVHTKEVLNELQDFLYKLEGKGRAKECYFEQANKLKLMLYHGQGIPRKDKYSTNKIQVNRLAYLDPTELDVFSLNGFSRFYSVDGSKAHLYCLLFLSGLLVAGGGRALLLGGTILWTGLKGIKSVYPYLPESIQFDWQKHIDKHRFTFTGNKYVSYVIGKLASNESNNLLNYRTNNGLQRTLSQYNSAISLAHFLTNATAENKSYFTEADVPQLNTLKDQLDQTENKIDDQHHLINEIVESLRCSSDLNESDSKLDQMILKINKVENEYKLKVVASILKGYKKNQGVIGDHLSGLNFRVSNVFSECVRQVLLTTNFLNFTSEHLEDDQ